MSRASPSKFASPKLWVAVAFALAGCSQKTEAPPAPTPEIPVVEVVQKDVPLEMELVGSLSGNQDVQIRARVEGYLRSIDYREGSRVKKGDLLFTIDDLPYKANLAQAQASLATSQSQLAKADLDVARYTPLARERAVSQAELDNAIAMQRSVKSQVQAHEAMVEQAKLNLGYTRITAPVAGVVGRSERKVGDLVGRGESTLLTVVSDTDPIRVTIAITEADYLRFAKPLAESGTGADAKKAMEPSGSTASTARLRLADGSEYPATGRLLFVDRAVDATTGTLRVDLGFENARGLLRPGQYARVRFVSETRRGALLVPQRAVQEIQGKYFAYVVGAGDKIETRTVKPGPRVGDLWLIEEGVKGGEKVVVAGFQRLKDGMVVKPVAPTPASAPQAAAGGK